MAQTTNPQISTPTNDPLDRFYTRGDTAVTCLALLRKRLPAYAPDLWVEPSAGDGAFLDLLPAPRFGLDIAPAAADIETGDFLAWRPDPTAKSVAVVGNPPFGKTARKAIAFFNHASEFADVIAMIMPASLSKGSMQDRLDPQFHLVDEMPLHAEPFRVGETLHEVNAVFQIWRREAFPRPKSVRKTTHSDFRFVADPMEADFTVRRVGGLAGAVLSRPASPDAKGYAPASNLFVQAVDIDPHELKDRFERLDVSAVRNCAVANPSVSKSDLVALYEAQRRLERVIRTAAEPAAAGNERAFAADLVLTGKAEDGDLVAMIVHHGGSDISQDTPPEEVEFIWRQDGVFVPVLHTALRGRRWRQAEALLADLFARRGPWSGFRETRVETTVLFRDAIVHLDPSDPMDMIVQIDMAPSLGAADLRIRRALEYRMLVEIWIERSRSRSPALDVT